MGMVFQQLTPALITELPNPRRIRGPLLQFTRREDTNRWSHKTLGTKLRAIQFRPNKIQQAINNLTWHNFATQLSAFFTKITDMPVAPTVGH
jgi:hypothetical protein